MKVLILLAGPHKVKGFDEPTTLLSTHGKTVIERLSEKVCSVVDPRNVISIMREEDVKTYSLDQVFKLAFENSIVIPVSGETGGAACSALLALDYLLDESELLVISGEEIIEVDFKLVIDSFRKRNADAGVVTFESIHPSYSFAQIDDEGLVTAVSEKRPISKNALVSFYYFKSTKDFVSGAKSIIRKHVVINGHFYLSPILNELILNDKIIRSFKIDQSHYHPLKNEIQVRNYLEQA